jgi:hypothetical protein
MSTNCVKLNSITTQKEQKPSLTESAFFNLKFHSHTIYLNQHTYSFKIEIILYITKNTKRREIFKRLSKKVDEYNNKR